MDFYAHTNEKKAWQPLKEHLQNVARLSRLFAEQFRMGEISYLIGLLHDLGKYSLAFQDRLKGSNELVNHTIAGAIEAKERYGKFLGLIMAYCISGHHGVNIF